MVGLPFYVLYFENVSSLIIVNLINDVVGSTKFNLDFHYATCYKKFLIELYCMKPIHVFAAVLC